MVNFVLVSVLAVFGLRAAAAPAGLPPAPACSGTQYLNTATNSCVDCSVAFVNSTACYYQGATQCSYGNAVNGACTEVVCTGNNYISDDGKSCVQCPDSQAATCDRQGVSTSCLQYGARIVKGACYQPVCTKTVLYDPESNTCIPCSSIYTNASTCDGYKGATGCAYGNFIVGQCVPQDCSKNVGTYLSGDGKSCVQCPDRGAATCAPGGGQSLSCIQAGARVNTTTGQCYKPTCTGTVLYDITSNKCNPCSTVFTNASTCTSTAATGCAYGNFMSGKCVPQTCTNNVRTYLSTDGKACVQCPDPRATACGAGGVSTKCGTFGIVKEGVCQACPSGLSPSFDGKSCGLRYAVVKGYSAEPAQLITSGIIGSFAQCVESVETYRQHHSTSNKAYSATWYGGSSTEGLCITAVYTGLGAMQKTDPVVFDYAAVPGTCVQNTAGFSDAARVCVDIIVTRNTCTNVSDGTPCANYVPNLSS